MIYLANFPGVVSPQIEEQICNLPNCCTFLEWSTWSDCPVTCNFGFVTRQRISTCSEVNPIVERRVS